MEIRTMRGSDEDGAYALIRSSLDEYFVPDVVSYFRMQWPTGQIVALDYFGNVIGYLAGSRLQNGNASVALFAVDGAYRGKGLGTMILNRFRQSALMDGFSVIQLEVKESNSSAREFYARRGFTATERLENFYNDGSAGIRMVSGNGGGCRIVRRDS